MNQRVKLSSFECCIQGRKLVSVNDIQNSGKTSNDKYILPPLLWSHSGSCCVLSSWLRSWPQFRMQCKWQTATHICIYIRLLRRRSGFHIKPLIAPKSTLPKRKNNQLIEIRWRMCAPIGATPWAKQMLIEAKINWVTSWSTYTVFSSKMNVEIQSE